MQRGREKGGEMEGRGGEQRNRASVVGSAKLGRLGDGGRKEGGRERGEECGRWRGRREVR